MQKNHVLDIYEQSADLEERLADYVAEALTGGDAVVVIAPSRRLALLEETLTGRGIDTGRSRTEGQLLEADSEELYRRIFSAGVLDRAAFTAVAGELTKMLRPRRRVRVVGELVDLLWSRGDVVGALALESEWVDFAREREFDLYCCYCADNVLGDEEALAQLQGLHDHVAAAPSESEWVRYLAVASFTASSDSPSAARRFTRQVLVEWQLDEQVDAACLAVSELGTNAVLHAGSGFEVSLMRRRGVLRIAVSDSSPQLPIALRSPTATSATGRGLGIVAALAGAWSAEVLPWGKRISLDLEIPER